MRKKENWGGERGKTGHGTGVREVGFLSKARWTQERKHGGKKGDARRCVR